MRHSCGGAEERRNMPEEGGASLGVRVVHHLRTLVAFGSAAVVVSADEETGAQTDVVV